MDTAVATPEAERPKYLFKLVDVEPVHRFSPGLYWRELAVPAGTFIVGKRHIRETMNILLKGRCSVIAGGKVMHLTAPHVFTSGPGVRKAVFVHEDIIWANAHPTDETDLEKIERIFIDTSPEALGEDARIRDHFKAIAEKGLIQ